MEKVPPAIPFEEIYAGTELHDEAVEALLEEGLDPRGPDMLFDLAGELGLARGQLVVDVGCGDGKKALELAKRFGCRVIGVEPIRANLERRQREPVETELVTFVQGRIEAIPLPYATADLVWARDMLVHVPDLVAGLRECRRVLKRDGRLLAFQMFATPWLEPAEASRLWPALAVLPQNVDPEHFEASAQAAGLTVARREEVRSEWREWEEEHGNRRTSRQLLHAARLLRDPARYIERFGRTAYEVELADCLWGVYQMVGKLSPRVYVLKPSWA